MKRFTWFLAAVLTVAFALPAFAGGDHAEKCQQSAQDCLNHFSAYKDRGWVGIEMDIEGEHMVVKTVVANSPASKGGFEVGDALLAVNGASLEDKEAVKKAQGAWAPGQKVTYTVLREGAKKDLSFALGEMPEEVFARIVGAHMINDHMASAQTADAMSEHKK